MFILIMLNYTITCRSHSKCSSVVFVEPDNIYVCSKLYYIFDIVWIFMTINVFSCVELYTLASPTVAAAVDILWCCNIQRHHERFSEATCSQGIGRLYQFVRRYPVTGSLSSSNCDRWRLCLQLSLFLPGLNLEAIYPPKIKKGK